MIIYGQRRVQLYLRYRHTPLQLYPYNDPDGRVNEHMALVK